MIIFLNARSDYEKPHMMRFLKENHVRYDHIIFNAGEGERNKERSHSDPLMWDFQENPTWPGQAGNHYDQRYEAGRPYYCIFYQHEKGSLLPVILLFVIGIVINGVSKMIGRILAAVFGGRAAYVFHNYLTWPGTVHHELSHALLAFLTGAKVMRISLIPHGQALGQRRIAKAIPL